MSKANPPQPPTESLMKRSKFIWRVLLISNFALGAYLFARTKKRDSMETQARTEPKLQKAKATVEVPPEPEPQPEPEPDPLTISLDSIYDDYLFLEPITTPLEVLNPIPEEQQRELFKSMLEERRQVKPKDLAEKKKIDQEKAILKKFIRAESIPKF